MRVRVGWASGILGALVLVGCVPADVPTSTAVASFAGTATGTAAPTPVLATSGGTSGPQGDGDLPSALAFPRRFVTAVNTSMRAADTAVLRSVIAPDCSGCEGTVTFLEDLIDAHQHLGGDAWHLTRSNVLTWAPGSAVLFVEVAQQAVDFLDTSGRRVKSMRQGTYRYELTIRADPAWRVTKWVKA